jgi:hypothetical protein
MYKKLCSQISVVLRSVFAHFFTVPRREKTYVLEGVFWVPMELSRSRRFPSLPNDHDDADRAA